MTYSSFDHFEGRFRNAGDRAVRFLLGGEFLGPLLASPLRDRLARVAQLPYVHGPVVVHPDVSVKPFGFPAGIALHTEPGWLYPLSAPDMGCGYLVVDSGITVDPDEMDRTAMASAYDGMLRQIAVDSPDRPDASCHVRDVLVGGLDALAAPAAFTTSAAPAEEHNDWPTELALLDPDFTDTTLQRSLGSAAGHFVACYVVQQPLRPSTPSTGRIIVVVHVGAAPIRDHLNRRGLFLDLAQDAVHSGISLEHDAADGLFAVDLDSTRGRALLGTAMAARNFGYANRQIVADRVIQALTAALPTAVVAPAVQLRHVDHTAFEQVDDAIRARRGLQPLHAARPVFITGGEHTHAYLCHSGDDTAVSDGVCCHGAPVRETPAVPPSVWDRPDLDVSPGALRGWVDTMTANTRFDESRFWADLGNIEGVIGQLASLGIARPAARLRQLMNYRELGL
ncbi:RNA-splicing ligase RtcB [Micromonospora violae]|uniref:3'-phosphate/5'-hydroxy nucleic acid ligase n=1 Tax=Micromonospora violae TaxID=1278207 RepID=A0A4Q7UAL1_9ACTN|nr:RtcB family protein [Micromonospora violae]RZT78075.1 RNA-splicing ligase RtcB [Micromonospora violae]